MWYQHRWKNALQIRLFRVKYQDSSADVFTIQSHPLSKFIASGNELGITFVFMARHKADIPIGCSYLIFAESMTKGTLVKSENREESTDFTYNPISNENAHKIVQFLAPVYCSAMIAANTQICSSILSLLQTKNLADVC